MAQHPNTAPSRSTFNPDDTHTAPPLQHNLDLALNDNDARLMASRHANTAAGSVTRRRRHPDLVAAVDSQAARAPLLRRTRTLPPYTDSYYTVAGLSPSAFAGL